MRVFPLRDVVVRHRFLVIGEPKAKTELRTAVGENTDGRRVPGGNTGYRAAFST